MLTWDDLNKRQQAYLAAVAEKYPAWVQVHVGRISNKLNPIEYTFMKDNNLIAVDKSFICCTPTGLAVYSNRTIQLEND